MEAGLIKIIVCLNGSWIDETSYLLKQKLD